MRVPTPIPRSPALQRWSLALLGTSIPFATAYLSVVPIALEAIRTPRRWMRTPVDLPIFVLLFWLILASIVAESRREALFASLLAVVAVYCFFQIPYRWFRTDPGLVTVLSRWALFIVPVATIAALCNFLWNPDLGLGSFRRFTLPNHPPAILAWGLEVTMLLGLGGLGDHLWRGIAMLGVGLFGLIETFSRWALLGFGAGMLAWSVMTVRQHARRVRVVILSLIVVMVIVVPLPVTRAILAQYAERGRERTGLVGTISRGFSLHPGLTERIVIWQTALRIVRDHPWFGVGAGAFGRVYLRYRDANLKDLKVLEEPTYLGTDHAHNEVLTMAVIGGIPAALAYLTLLAVGLRHGLAWRAPASIPAVSALVAIVVHGMFDGLTTTFVGPLVVVWTVLAAAIQRGAQT